MGRFFFYVPGPVKFANPPLHVIIIIFKMGLRKCEDTFCFVSLVSYELR